MVIIYSKRNILYISWTERDRFTGKMVRLARSLRMKDSKTNRKIAETYKKEKLKELSVNPVVLRHFYRLEDAVEDFLKTKTGVNRVGYKVALDHLGAYYGDVMVREITDLHGFLDYLKQINFRGEKEERKLTTNTLVSYMRSARIFFNFLFTRRFISEKPEIPRIKKQRTRSLPCPVPVVKVVLDHLKEKMENHDPEDDRDYRSQYLSVLILVMTGLRSGELCRLRWEDINFERNFIFVDNTKGNQENQMFTMFPTLVKRLSPYRKDSGKVVSYQRPDSLRFWNRVLKELNFPHYPIKSLRKTFGSEMARISAPREVTQILLRHSDYKTSDEHYVFADLEDLSAYAEAAIGSQF